MRSSWTRGEPPGRWQWHPTGVVVFATLETPTSYARSPVLSGSAVGLDERFYRGTSSPRTPRLLNAFNWLIGR